MVYDILFHMHLTCASIIYFRNLNLIQFFFLSRFSNHKNQLNTQLFSTVISFNTCRSCKYSITNAMRKVCVFLTPVWFIFSFRYCFKPHGRVYKLILMMITHNFCHIDRHIRGDRL